MFLVISNKSNPHKHCYGISAMYRKPADTLTPREALHRQGYNFISEKSSAAVKPCMWCKRAVRGGESCYKHQFYGIETAKCVQMTPTLRCNQRCVFCWRSMEYEIEPDVVLSPEEIVSAIPALQRKGLSGDKPFSNPEFWKEATAHPTQFAVSLSGEPTLYPKLPELITLLKEGGRSVFVVSNGTNPSMIQKIVPTQLYLSLDAGCLEQYEKICRPIGNASEMWENIQKSLDLLQEKEAEGVRTAVRTTLVKGLNDTDEDAASFAKIIMRTKPMYVEIKGYMYLGYSRIRLSETAAPDMTEIRAFAGKTASLSRYELMDENEPSRVVVMRRQK